MMLATITYDGALSPVAWLILFGVLAFIFGTIGWGVYRALLADKKQKAAAQQAFKKE